MFTIWRRRRCASVWCICIHLITTWRPKLLWWVRHALRWDYLPTKSRTSWRHSIRLLPQACPFSPSHQLRPFIAPFLIDRNHKACKLIAWFVNWNELHSKNKDKFHLGKGIRFFATRVWIINIAFATILSIFLPTSFRNKLTTSVIGNYSEMLIVNPPSLG